MSNVLSHNIWLMFIVDPNSFEGHYSFSNYTDMVILMQIAIFKKQTLEHRSLSLEIFEQSSEVVDWRITTLYLHGNSTNGDHLMADSSRVFFDWLSNLHSFYH